MEYVGNKSIIKIFQNMHVPNSPIGVCENIIIPEVAEDMYLFWEIISRLFLFSLFSPVENQLL